MARTELQHVNGVDVTQLGETVQAIREQPGLARFRFRAATTWKGGAQARTRIQGFYGAGQEDASRDQPFLIEGDEPPVLLGSNTAPNAVEALLHALTSCLTVGFAYNAAAQDIELRSLELEAEGELDLHGFLGLDENVRAGYDTVRVNYRVDADASDERIDELCAYVQRTSPVLDMLRNPLDVKVERSA